MSDYIYQEMNMFLIAVVIGILVRCIYDIFLILRSVHKHKRITTGIEDFLYWTFVGIFVFLMSFRYNNGNVRGYIIIGVLIGVIFYHYAISKMVVKVLSMILNHIIKFISKITGFFRKRWIRIKRVFKKFFVKNFLKPLKKTPKVVTIHIKDRERQQKRDR